MLRTRLPRIARTRPKATLVGLGQLVKQTRSPQNPLPEQETQATENSASSPEGSLVDVAVAVARAITIQQEGDKQEAIELWRAIAVISEGQDDNLAARAWFSRALLNQAADREQAIDDYGKAIELDQDDDAAYSNRGNAKTDLGRPKDAIDDFTAALELNPGYVNAHVGRGIANYYLGRQEQAWGDFDEAIKLKPELEHRLSVFLEAL